MAVPNLITDEKCPFCDFNFKGTDKVRNRPRAGWAEVDCPVCGSYVITGEAIDIQERWTISEDKRTAIAFSIRRMTDRAETLRLTSDIIRQIKDSTELLRPESLLDEAVLWIGRHSEHVGQRFQITFPGYRTILGAGNILAFNFITEWMVTSDYFSGLRASGGGTGDPALPVRDCCLNPEGWRRYTELTESRAASRYGLAAQRLKDTIRATLPAEARLTD